MPRLRHSSYKPYQGTEPYIFVSYAHRDGIEAMAIIRRLQRTGYRVWYDEGIDPGTEWDENIATHVETSGYFLALLSENYLRSENCKDELNYARSLDKPRLLVYLDEVRLPGGLSMRLGRLQAIHKPHYDNEEDFYEKLFSSAGIDACLGPIDESDGVATQDNSASEGPGLTAATANGQAFMPTMEVGEARVILIVDTSGSMMGSRIKTLNEAIDHVDKAMTDTFGSRASLRILQYSTEACWKKREDLPLKASGMTDMGMALRMLQAYGAKDAGHVGHVLIFINDGLPTDDYVVPLRSLMNERWFVHATKAGIAIGDGADEEMMSRLVGASYVHTPVTDDNIGSLVNIIESIVIASVSKVLFA